MTIGLVLVFSRVLARIQKNENSRIKSHFIWFLSVCEDVHATVQKCESGEPFFYPFSTEFLLISTS